VPVADLERELRPPPAITPERPRAITWRSVLLGLAGTILICALTPYNDYVLGNTYIVGNNLPLGVVVLAFGVAVCVNAPLSRFAPRHALTSGELGVAMAMVLGGCALPSNAWMRYWPGGLVYPLWTANQNAEVRGLLEGLGLPAWLWPTMAGAGPREWGNDPVVAGFVGRWTGGGPPPYGAWVRPALTWGVYCLAFHGAMICLIALVRRQWFENERLPFPLAQIQLGLVEAPARGRWFNDLLGRRAFWVAFAAVFCLHTWNALHAYYPKSFPEIPIKFDFQQIMGEAPWVYSDLDFKTATLFLTAAGVSFLLPGAVSFSLWAFYLMFQVERILLGTITGDPAPPGVEDQRFGAMLTYVGIVIWIGRAHWRLVLRQAVRGPRGDEPRGRYLSYPIAFWGFVTCAAAMVAWLVMAGATVVGATIITVSMLLGFFLVARVVAETGLLHMSVTIFPNAPFRLLSLGGLPNAFPLPTVYLAGTMQHLHFSIRETFIAFGSHGVKVLDQTAFEARPQAADTAADRRLGRRVIALFALTLVVAYTVSLGSTLWAEYGYAIQQNKTGEVVNPHVARTSPNVYIINPTLNYQKDNYVVKHNPFGHVIGGAAVTGVLSVLRLRYAWWPLHPVGYLCVGTYPIRQLWYSILLGWLVRTLVLRFGGSRLYANAKPVILGVIVGEAVAAGFWLAIGFVASANGWDYESIRLLPG
jgi:hypothetical protein